MGADADMFSVWLVVKYADVESVTFSETMKVPDAEYV